MKVEDMLVEEAQVLSGEEVGDLHVCGLFVDKTGNMNFAMNARFIENLPEDMKVHIASCAAFLMGIVSLIEDRKGFFREVCEYQMRKDLGDDYKETSDADEG